MDLHTIAGNIALRWSASRTVNRPLNIWLLWSQDLVAAKAALCGKFVTSCFSDKVFGVKLEISWIRACTEPAKLADRVIAPGEGSAEPGVTIANPTEPAKLATDA